MADAPAALRSPTVSANANVPTLEPVKARPSLRLTDGMVMRAVFFALLGFTAVILYRDFEAMRSADADLPAITPGTDQPVLPGLPQTAPGDSGADDSADRRRAPAVVTDPDTLRGALDIDLVAGGVLRLTGTIEPGSAARFVAETAERMEYVQVVELDSPGGSVTDALDISQAIREAGWNTRVRNGALCASSCPLIFAGGAERVAGADAAIGVHQMFTTSADGRSRADSISGTQSLTARITRHLDAMGVDGQLWVNAMETPPQYLYYLTVEELKDWALATEVVDKL